VAPTRPAGDSSCQHEMQPILWATQAADEPKASR
jgi:hypothetical protein